MECPKCKATIDDDSYFCDLCGTELMMCPKCRAPRKGKRCTQCGSVLVPASSLDGQAVDLPQPTVQTQPTVDVAASAPVPSRMVNVANPSAVVVLKDGALIGRTSGDYIDVFGTDGYTSGRHAELRLTLSGWTIADLGSTNGTRVDGRPLTPNVPVPITIGTTVEIGSHKYRVE